MLEKATHEGLLAPLADTGLRQHTPIYADDVVTFLKPRVDDLKTFVAIVGDFGVASGLRTNLSKCSAQLGGRGGPCGLGVGMPGATLPAQIPRPTSWP
jgi:hypothetical protein